MVGPAFGQVNRAWRDHRVRERLAGRIVGITEEVGRADADEERRGRATDVPKAESSTRLGRRRCRSCAVSIARSPYPARIPPKNHGLARSSCWHAACSPSTRRDRASLRTNPMKRGGFADDV